MEKTIPFSFTSDNELLEESLNIKGLNNVKIKDMYVDNGNMKVGDFVEVKIFDFDGQNFKGEIYEFTK